jgi:hypothetical protein
VIETLRYYEPVAEWLLLFFVIYEVLDKIVERVRAKRQTAESRAVTAKSRFWPWIAAAFLATAIVWAPSLLPYLVSTKTISGTADVPEGKYEITVPVDASLPYTVHYKTDWTTGGDTIKRKQSGRFTLRFAYGPPPGGGSIDWEVIPRTGSQAVGFAEPSEPTATPTAQPESLVQQFVENSGPWQKCANLVQTDPIPGPHSVNVIATESSHDFAVRAVSCFRDVGHWTVIAHGQRMLLSGIHLNILWKMELLFARKRTAWTLRRYA